MGLFDNLNNSSGNGSPKDKSGNPFDGSGNPFDGSGNPFGSFDGSGNPFGSFDGSGGLFDISGRDASGIGQFLGVLPMFGVAALAGLVVVLLFVSSQNLIYLTSKTALNALPVNVKAPPYSRNQNGGLLPPGIPETFMNKIFHGYGPPYSFVHNATVFPFIPCNYSTLRDFFGLKSWIGDTLIHTWINSRKFLKVILGGLSELPKWIKIPFAFIFMLLLILPTPLISIVFTLMASFHTNVGWSILGILFGILPVIIALVSISQLIVLSYYLFISPLMSKAGRQFTLEQVKAHHKSLSIVYILVLIGISPMFINPLWTIGMILGVIIFGF